MVRNQKGFALPLVLLLLLLMSALVAAQLASAQFLIAHLGDQSRKTVTLYAADGMVEYGLAVMPDTLSVGDSVSIGNHTFASNLVGVMSLFRTDTITIDTAQAYTLYGESQLGAVDRTIAFDLVVRGRPVWDSPAGIIAAKGFTKNGNSGMISGNDVCGDPVPAIVAPDGSIYDNDGLVDGSEPWMDGGVEFVDPNDLDSILGFNQWEYLRNELEPDYEVWGPGDWPTDFTHWPTIKVMNSSYVFDDFFSGRGTIIAPDGFTFGGEFTWEGIILVGDDITINGNANLNGSIATGLDELLGLPTNPSDLGNGTMNFTYNSCSVKAALVFSNPVREPESWRIIR